MKNNALQNTTYHFINFDFLSASPRSVQAIWKPSSNKKKSMAFFQWFEFGTRDGKGAKSVLSPYAHGARAAFAPTLTDARATQQLILCTMIIETMHFCPLSCVIKVQFILLLQKIYVALHWTSERVAWFSPFSFSLSEFWRFVPFLLYYSTFW